MAKFFTAPTWTNNQLTGMQSDRLFARMNYNQVGYSVVRDAAGAFTQVIDADDDLVRTSTAFYFGGRTYSISDSQAADLTAAGYGAFITTV